jgi:hypothetical protein
MGCFTGCRETKYHTSGVKNYQTLCAGCHKTVSDITLRALSRLISNLMQKIIYLRIIYFLKSSTCCEDYTAHLQVVYVVIVYMQPLVSSLSAGDCSVHRLRKNSFLTGEQDSHLQIVKIPEAA